MMLMREASEYRYFHWFLERKHWIWQTKFILINSRTHDELPGQSERPWVCTVVRPGTLPSPAAPVRSHREPARERGGMFLYFDNFHNLANKNYSFILHRYVNKRIWLKLFSIHLDEYYYIILNWLELSRLCLLIFRYCHFFFFSTIWW